jgi:hypothetical protein
VTVSGQYVTVQGITLQNSAGYNLEVRGARQVVIQGNRFLANGASDSLKGDGGAADVTVRDNEFTQWDSQAIDITGVSRWTIERNRIHDPKGVDAKAIGIKFGSRDITVVNNEIFNTEGLSLGGVSSATFQRLRGIQPVRARQHLPERRRLLRRSSIPARIASSRGTESPPPAPACACSAPRPTG